MYATGQIKLKKRLEHVSNNIRDWKSARVCLWVSICKSCKYCIVYCYGNSVGIELEVALVS